MNLNDSKFLCINHLRVVEPCGILRDRGVVYPLLIVENLLRIGITFS